MHRDAMAHNRQSSGFLVREACLLSVLLNFRSQNFLILTQEKDDFLGRNLLYSATLLFPVFSTSPYLTLLSSMLCLLGVF